MARVKFSIGNITRLNRPTCLHNRCCSSNGLSQPLKKNVEGLFLDARVQRILRKITGYDIGKLCRPVQVKLSTPKYQFLTDKQLEEMRKTADKKAKTKLEMPPFMKERKPICDIINKDPELQGLMSSNVLFIDLTQGLSDKERHVVVREPNGILRKASWQERERMLQIYFPVDGRNLRIPRMFQETHLQNVLDQQNYEHLLNRACLQFQPDDPEYLRVIGKTFEHIDCNKKHHVLRSTRHFGPMAFFMVLRQDIDNLLSDMIQREMFEDAGDLVRLYHLVHPDCSSAKTLSTSDDMELVIDFIEKDAKKCHSLQMVFETFKEIQKQRSLLEDHISKSSSGSSS